MVKTKDLILDCVIKHSKRHNDIDMEELLNLNQNELNFNFRNVLFFSTLPYILKVSRKNEPHSFEELFQLYSLRFLEYLSKNYIKFIKKKDKKYQSHPNLTYFFDKIAAHSFDKYLSEKLTFDCPINYNFFRKKVKRFINEFEQKNFGNINLENLVNLINVNNVDSLLTILNQFNLRYSISTISSYVESFSKAYKLIKPMGLFYNPSLFNYLIHEQDLENLLDETLELGINKIDNISNFDLFESNGFDTLTDFDRNISYIDLNFESFEIYHALLHVKKLLINQYLNVIKQKKNNLEYRKNDANEKKIYILDLILPDDIDMDSKSKCEYFFCNILKNRKYSDLLVNKISEHFNLKTERSRQLYVETVKEYYNLFKNEQKRI